MLGVLAAAHPVLADEGVDARAKAQAEALFREGKRLYDAGDYASSCPKLEGAVTLTKGEALGGKMVLAACYERIGRLASALGLYAEVAARATTMGQPARAKDAELQRDALVARVPKLDVRLAPAVAAPTGLVVRIGGVEQPVGALGVPLPVDAGTIVVTAHAPGKLPFERNVLVPNEAGTVPVLLGPFADANAASTAGPASDLTPAPHEAHASTTTATETDTVRLRARSARLPSDDGDARDDARFWSTGRVVGVTVGTVGAATAIAGFIASGIAKSRYDEAKSTAGCDNASPPVCEIVDGMRRARDLGSVATVLVAGGGAAAAIGAVTFAIAGPSASSERAQLRLRPSVGGAWLEGSF